MANRFVIAFMVFVALNGCASTPATKDGVLSTDKQMAAVVYGQGGDVSRFLTVLVPIGTFKNISLTGIDGGGAQAAPNTTGREYWIVPGTHKLEISCLVQYDNKDTYGTSIVEIALERGKEYLLDAKPAVERSTLGPIRTCEPFVVAK